MKKRGAGEKFPFPLPFHNLIIPHVLIIVKYTFKMIYLLFSWTDLRFLNGRGSLVIRL